MNRGENQLGNNAISFIVHVVTVFQRACQNESSTCQYNRIGMPLYCLNPIQTESFEPLGKPGGRG